MSGFIFIHLQPITGTGAVLQCRAFVAIFRTYKTSGSFPNNEVDKTSKFEPNAFIVDLLVNVRVGCLYVADCSDQSLRLIARDDCCYLLRRFTMKSAATLVRWTLTTQFMRRSALFSIRHILFRKSSSDPPIDIGAFQYIWSSMSSGRSATASWWRCI